MKDFRTLKVWNKAHEITLATYGLTRSYPREEMYGLTSQMRGCASSIAANIAEGCGRSGSGDFHRSLSIAMGSAAELKYFALLSRDLALVTVDVHLSLEEQISELQRLLASLIRKVETDKSARTSNADC
jgi:four helix bundle protein